MNMSDNEGIGALGTLTLAGFINLASPILIYLCWWDSEPRRLLGESK